MKYAKDPIDFIRHFNFATWTQACGVGTASTRIETALCVRLTTPRRQGADFESHDVWLTGKCHPDAASALADWLANDSRFTVLPFAGVMTGDSSPSPAHGPSQTIVLQLTGCDDLETIALEMGHLVSHVNTVIADIRRGSTSLILTKAERTATNTGGYGVNTLGQQPVDNSRVPQQDLSRIPTSMYHGNTSGFKNFEDK